MTEQTQQADLVALSEETEAHLTAKGLEVEITVNADVTAFEILDKGEMVARVQSVRDDFWEVVRPNGETLTGIGGKQTYLTMVERVVAATVRKAA